MPPIRRHNARTIEQDWQQRQAYLAAARDLRAWYVRAHHQHREALDPLQGLVLAAATALEGAGYTMEAQHHPTLQQGLDGLVTAVARLLDPPAPGRGMPPIQARPAVR